MCIRDSLNSLGLVAIYQEDYAAATRYFEEALAIARALGNREAVGKFLTNLGLVAERQGDYPLAIRRYEESLAILREIGARHAALLNVLNLGDVATAQGDDEAAGRYYLEVLPEALALGALHVALGTVRGLAGVQARAGNHAQAARLIGLVLSHPASSAEERSSAEPILTFLQDRLPAAALEAALAQGKALLLETVAEELVTLRH